MKILYGVQGTGNGHITRARVMAKELKLAGIEVQYLFSGRSKDKYFDMDIFGNYFVYDGLTMNMTNGKVHPWKTLISNNLFNFHKDILGLDLRKYDLIISDYEPIVSWAGKFSNKIVIGIGHQYAFNYNIPKTDNNYFTDKIMKYFAPVDIGIGLHWNSFGERILPPIIDTVFNIIPGDPKKILVYLAFDNPNIVFWSLALNKDYEFYVYGLDEVKLCRDGLEHINNVHIKQPSREGFLKDLEICGGVICGAGFELISESLNMGKRILVKPVQGQLEQMSNAKALVELGYGTSMEEISHESISGWLNNSKCTIHMDIPNVAKEIVQWIKLHGWINGVEIDTQTIWNQVKISTY